jgi:hypothetical protein
VSVFGYSTAAGERLVEAACHTADTLPEHQNQEFDLLPSASSGGSSGWRLRNRWSRLCAGASGTGLLQEACGNASWHLPTAGAPAPWRLLDGRGLCVSASAPRPMRMPNWA